MGWAFAYPSSIHSVGGEEADQRPETEDSPTFLVILLHNIQTACIKHMVWYLRALLP